MNIDELSHDELKQVFKDLYKRAEHTVLSLQETDTEHSVGFGSLKQFVEHYNKNVTNTFRNWSEFKAQPFPVEYMCPYIFITLLIKSLNISKDCEINFNIIGIVNKSEVTGDLKEDKHFGHLYNNSRFEYVYIPLNKENYLEIDYAMSF